MPARGMRGKAGKPACTSGRAPSPHRGLPMYPSALAGSPLTGSRRIRTPVTSTSSSVQPVTAIDPVTPVVPLMGVSNDPKGAVALAADLVVSVTPIGPGLLPAPV